MSCLAGPRSVARHATSCKLFAILQAVLSTGSDADYNLVVQMMRLATQRQLFCRHKKLLPVLDAYTSSLHSSSVTAKCRSCCAQPCRNPITAASILGTGASVG